MFLVITGNGKGKTTSAIGTAIRGLGSGKKVALVFFDKGGSHYGEQKVFDFLQGPFSVLRFGQQRFDEKSGIFRFNNTDEDRNEAKKGVAAVMKLYSQNYFLIICDELIKSVKDLIEKCPDDTHLMITGRNAPKWMIKKADLVSEVKEVKHYFKKGVKAIKGIDY